MAPKPKRPTTNSEGAPISTDPKARAAFWRWFGRSAIVDDVGRPLVVCHGTNASFETFSAGEFGFHFGNESAADMFGTTRKYYLSIKNPLVVHCDMGNWAPEDMAQALPYPEDDVLEEFQSDRDEALDRVGVLRDMLRDDLDQDDDMLRNRRAVYALGEPVRQLYVKYGFDGVIYKNEAEGFGVGGQPNWSYIALFPEQVRRVEFPGLPLGTGPARAANPDRDIRKLERAVAADPDDRQAQMALLAARARLGDPMALARIQAHETYGLDAEPAVIDAETARIVRTMTAPAWKRVPLRSKAALAQAIMDRAFRRAGLANDPIRPRVSVRDGVIYLVNDADYSEDWPSDTMPQDMAQRADEWVETVFDQRRELEAWERQERAELAQWDQNQRDYLDSL